LLPCSLRLNSVFKSGSLSFCGVKVREFQARLLVANLATKAGYKVLFGQDRVIRRLIGHLPKGIVFDKSIGRKGDRKVAMFSSHGWVITALDEESTGYLDYPEVFSANRLAEETLNVTSRWFCLSDNVQKDISKRYPNHQNKFVTTGLIRMDLWRTQFQNLYEKDVEALRRKHGKFILFLYDFIFSLGLESFEIESFTMLRLKRNLIKAEVVVNRILREVIVFFFLIISISFSKYFSGVCMFCID